MKNKLRFYWDYSCYRISRFYKRVFRCWVKDDYFTWGPGIMVGALYFFVAPPFLVFIHHLFNVPINKALAFILYIPFLIFEDRYIYSEKGLDVTLRKYKEYDRRFKNERFKFLKGLAVFFFLVLSIVSMVIVYKTGIKFFGK